MATTKAKKNQMLDDIRKVLGHDRNLVVAEYRGLTVEQISNLRTALRKAGARFKVMKNTLVRKVSHEFGLEKLNDQFRGPVGIAFLGKDVAAAAKTLVGFAKTNEKFAIKAGFIDSQVISLDGVKTLAALPPREVLLARLLGSMQSPLRGFMTVAQGNTRKLLYALNDLQAKKSLAAA